MAETVRLQVDITPSQLAELEQLRELGGLKTKRELWDTAFTLLKWAARKKRAGAAIGSISEEGGDFMELEMPFLEHYATSLRANQDKDNGSVVQSQEVAVGATVTPLASLSGNGTARTRAGKRKRR